MIRAIINRLRARLRAMPDIEGLKADGLQIGERCFVGRRVTIDAWHCWLISIGDGCYLSPEVMILAHDASTKPSTGYTRLRRTTIGNRVYVGARAIILPGVTVGDDAVIGAGAIVARDVPPGSVVAGNPAKVVGTTMSHAAKHRGRMAERPVYPREGWTLGTGITPERKAEMRDALADGGEGYIP